MGKGEGDLRLIRLDEVTTHNNAQSTWIILDDYVYDVTKFLMEHPGGEEVILNLAGQDATEAFNDVGHSTDAIEMAKDFLVGKIHPDDQKNAKEPAETTVGPTATWSEIIFSPTWTNFLIPLAISAGVYFVFKLSQRLVSNVFGNDS
ncbi:Cytochrome b5 [Aphelenchoides besseyi]|nr:Cytochrome b5 [Aphelenchoides besseyi]KAI6209876.1 Cytochrome b5 [Aphelenchoides besseyi]